MTPEELDALIDQADIASLAASAALAEAEELARMLVGAAQRAVDVAEERAMSLHTQRHLARMDEGALGVGGAS